MRAGTSVGSRPSGRRQGSDSGFGDGSAEKSESGTVRVDFKRAGNGFELVCEDDGTGLNPEQLKAAAVRKQLVTEVEAASMDNRAVMALIFALAIGTSMMALKVHTDHAHIDQGSHTAGHQKMALLY